MLNFIALPKRKLFLGPLLALTLGLASCGAPTPTTNGGGGGTTPQATGGRVSLVGAGASFPAPLYQRWFSDYNRNVNPNVQITYQSVGSGAGIEQFTQGITDFGASDTAMTDEQIAAVPRGVVLLPMTAGSIVLAFNLPGVEQLNLSRETYAGIFLGDITRWNDPAIAADNPGVTLPDLAITAVTRSDGSGTTGVFTQHLDAISPKWKERVGSGLSVSWPAGIASRGNEGVTATITQTEGTIGYVEFSFAKSLGIPFATLENKAGNFVAATPENASASLAAVELPENLRAFIFDPDGENSYPIVTYTWVLAFATETDPAKLEAFRSVMTWALENGQDIAADLGYIPLPPEVVEKVKAALATLE
ncbi:phosphate ABC transporter substrate-binding protein PstS [Gloeocapsa sp. PCC 73106]|uniref:phosphate ABC transporter substrate-binding protein PstS n=1 Tax=Gloeocapsa sp. PCC 73106 TaxID=102232 RepID=UPI0002ABE2C3|nr:phosphate ABC transporter substrate-binding protein PstS [Gloeocapsa sp. PCC 73106]ELR99425.1 phosphate ABC transporter, phosphate-binding protein [Gloeocapsa sp. PCC 73106]